MPIWENENEVDLGNGRILEITGNVTVEKFLKPEQWIKKLYRFTINAITNNLSFNSTNRILTSEVGGVTSSVVLPTWNIIDDLTVAEEISNSTTTFANITGLGQTLLAGAVYEMECIIVYNTAATTTGINLSYAGIGAPTIYANYISIPTATTTEVVRHYAAPNTETASTGTARVNNNIAIMKIIFGCGTTGLYYPRFASEVAGSAITIKRGTCLKIRRLS